MFCEAFRRGMISVVHGMKLRVGTSILHRRRVALCVIALLATAGGTSARAFMPDNLLIDLPQAVVDQLSLRLANIPDVGPQIALLLQYAGSLRGTITHKAITVTALVGEKGGQSSLITDLWNIPVDQISDRAKAAANEIGAADAQVDYDDAISGHPSLQGFLSYLSRGFTGGSIGPDHHFDSETFLESQKRIKTLTEAAAQRLRAGNVREARDNIGKLLHTLQDFYSHSDWVEMHQGSSIEPIPALKWQYPDFPDFDSSLLVPTPIPPFAYLRSCDGAQWEPDDLGHLTSGYYGDWTNLSRPSGCIHGGPFDSLAGKWNAAGGLLGIGPGLNKDTLNPVLSPHSFLHLEAARVAREATSEYFKGFFDLLASQTDFETADRLMRSLLSVGEGVSVTNNNLTSPVQVSIDIGRGSFSAFSEFLDPAGSPGSMQVWELPDLNPCIPCSIGSGQQPGKVYELVLTGTFSFNFVTGLIGYTLALPPTLEFIDVTSDRDPTKTIPLSGREHTDLFVLSPLGGPPHRTNTYHVQEVPR